MARSVNELKQRVENADLWDNSANETQCDDCFYEVTKEGIGYRAHKDPDIVVGAVW